MSEINIIGLFSSVEAARIIIEKQPKFILEAVNQYETMYNPRTQKYIVQTAQSALIQSEGEDYFHTTMSQSSSFYDECIRLVDLKKQLDEIG